MAIKFCLATKDNLKGVAEIEKICFFEPWSESALELFLQNENFCVLCKDENEVISYCTVTTVLDEAQIINVATNSTRRGRGYAKGVIELVLCECKKRAVSSVSLEVRTSNEGAISLYKQFGFDICGERKNFYTNPRENAYVMVKNID